MYILTVRITVFYPFTINFPITFYLFKNKYRIPLYSFSSGDSCGGGHGKWDDSSGASDDFIEAKCVAIGQRVQWVIVVDGKRAV